jgi:hypothetical protein
MGAVRPQHTGRSGMSPPDERRPRQEVRGRGGAYVGNGGALPRVDEGPDTVGVQLAPAVVAELAGAIRAEHVWPPMPPVVSCPFCAAGPLEPCVYASRRLRRRDRRLRLTPGGCHPSRRAAA